MSDFLFAVYEPAFKACMSPVAIEAGKATDAEREGLPIRVEGRVAVIPVSGPMMKSPYARYYSTLTNTPDVTQAIKRAGSDPDIDKVLLILDSPGGSTAGLSELGDAIREVAANKPVIAQVDGICASACYYLASQATEIYAHRMDMVGSIGVRLMLYDFSEMFKEAGIKPVVIDTGEHKSAGAMGTKITDEQKQEFQRIVDSFFADFKEMVTSGRNMDEQQFKSVSDGRMFFADEAFDLGLIDGVQTLETTLANIFNDTPSTSTQSRRARLHMA